MLKIGISSSFFPADDKRAIFKSKTLLYVVQNLSDWVVAHGALAYIIPSLPANSSVAVSDFVKDLDGLLLQGGTDVSPEAYGETALKPEWGGDSIRDKYEIALIKEFISQRKPILGVCRGLQVLNVALGGTLYQDIPTQFKTRTNHRNWDIYESNVHDIKIETDSHFSRIYPKLENKKVNSIHHQAIKKLAPLLEVEATSQPDGLIEAVRMKGDLFVVAVQWHPEFQKESDSTLISTEPLMREFLKQAETCKL